MRRKRKIMILATAILCGLILGPPGAQATLITIQIEAVVDDVQGPDNYLEGRIKVGDLITGRYIYDTDTPDSHPYSHIGRYEHYDYPCGISLSVAGLDFKTDPGNTYFVIQITNDNTVFYDDTYVIESYRNLPLSDGTSVGSISWGLIDYSGTVISSPDLTATTPLLDDWDSDFLHFWAGPGGGRGCGVVAHVTSAVVIPEPGTILLLGLGGVALLRVGRK